MKKLHELTRLIRSKNAGPFVQSLDIIFVNHETYQKVIETGILSVNRIAKLYNVPQENVNRHELPLAHAVKFSFPRPHPSGDFLDDDLYGCQKHRPLVELEIPLE